MDKKLIFFDLDDTLLKKDKSVSSKTLEVLRLLQARGHKIIIATARNKVMTMDIAKMLSADYTIINAGAYILKRDTIIRDLVIPKEIVKTLVGLVSKDAKVLSFQTDEILYTTDNKAPRSDIVEIKLDDIDNIGDVYKVLTKDLDIKKGEKIGDELNLNFTNYFGGGWSRFCDVLATKGMAMEFITKYEGMNLSDTIAFGDDLGDMEMIIASEVGVAMDNALFEVKNVANYICESNENDGVARFLDKYFNLGVY